MPNKAKVLAMLCKTNHAVIAFEESDFASLQAIEEFYATWAPMVFSVIKLNVEEFVVCGQWAHKPANGKMQGMLNWAHGNQAIFISLP